MKAGSGRKWDWCALMTDVHPDELKHCLSKTAFLYVHPNQYREAAMAAFAKRLAAGVTPKKRVVQKMTRAVVDKGSR
jgi:hypothetical protein